MHPELRHLEPGVTDFVERVRGLVHFSYTNDLTNLLNRRALIALSQKLLFGQVDGSKVAVAYLDITSFKDINTHHGHKGGDAAIIEVAIRWKKIADTLPGIAFHLSGDEFAMVLEPKHLDAFPDEWAKNFSACSIDYQGKTVTIRTNVGLAEPEAGLGVEGLAKRAEEACGEAKLNNKAVVRWSPEVATAANSHSDARWRCICGAAIKVTTTTSTPLRCPVCSVARPIGTAPAAPQTPAPVT